MADIILVWKPIDVTGGLAYHQFLLHRDDSGFLTYLRGGPASRVDGSWGQGSQSSGSSSGSVTGFGTIKTDVGAYAFETIDYPKNGNVGPDGLPVGWPSQVMASGNGDPSINALISKQFFSMADLAQRIQNANIPYDPVIQNSNSVIGTVLRNEGFDPPPSGIGSGNLAPAWNTDLRSFVVPSDKTYLGQFPNTNSADIAEANGIVFDAVSANVRDFNASRAWFDSDLSPGQREAGRIASEAA